MRPLVLIIALFPAVALSYSCDVSVGESQCPKGCCPLPESVCCGDSKTCCPRGLVCHAETGSCVTALGVVKMNSLPLITATPPSNVVSPKVSCAETQTACNWTVSTATCCPVPEAVCCKDNNHCCPKGYICDDQPQICRYPDDSNAPADPKPVTEVKCDSTHACPTGNTCCKLASGQWGCCPRPQAVCCADKVHCCPNGYMCEGTRCRKGNSFVEMLRKSPAIVKAPEAVKCDSSHACPTGNTCCKLPTGSWGCCPAVQAACCSDGMHCCPHGYSCAGTKCVKGNLVAEFLTKSPALSTPPKAVMCDSSHECPPDNTCCKLASGQWGCCPRPQAVCCADKVHCCPNGYTCEGTLCRKGNSFVEMLRKSPAIVKAPEAVRCDSSSYCPSGSTCCILPSGDWGCCPLPNAECCPDKQHCCPSGYTCSGTQCVSGNSVVDMVKKTPARKLSFKAEVKCDAETSCPSRTTCCMLASGQWGCCPLPNAVCCPNKEYCCPEGYTCSGTQCISGDSAMSKLPARRLSVLRTAQSEVQKDGIVCPDQSTCDAQSTCCMMVTGGYACCPTAKAVCCSDFMHCCPAGSKCNAAGQTCAYDNGVSLPWHAQKQSTQSLGSVQGSWEHKESSLNQ